MGERALDKDASWAAVRQFMERACGVVIDEDQRYLLETRLQPAVKRLGRASIADLVRRALAGEAESSTALVDALTTHETFFFRDPGFWKTLKDELLPARLAGDPRRKLRLWSAACSTGQEPYSLAMLLAEHFPEAAARAEIIASDVSPLSIEQAREGVYSSLEVNRGLGAARLPRFFDAHPGGFRVKPELRARVRFCAHNLLAASGDPAHCDVVLCRNVLIYFKESDRQRVVDRLFRATVAGGFVGVGTSELIKRPLLAPGWYAHHESSKVRSI